MFFELYKSKSYDTIEKLYGIPENTTEPLIQYISDAYYNGFLGGNEKSFLSQDLLWDYQSDLLVKLRTQGSYLEGYRIKRG